MTALARHFPWTTAFVRHVRLPRRAWTTAERAALRRSISPVSEAIATAWLFALWVVCTAHASKPFQIDDFVETSPETAMRWLGAVAAAGWVLGRAFRRPLSFALLLVAGALAAMSHPERWVHVPDYHDAAYLYQTPSLQWWSLIVVLALPMVLPPVAALAASRALRSRAGFVLGFLGGYAALFLLEAMLVGWMEIPWQYRQDNLRTPETLLLLPAGIALAGAFWLPRQRVAARRLLVGVTGPAAGVAAPLAAGMVLAAAVAVLLHSHWTTRLCLVDSSHRLPERIPPHAVDATQPLLEYRREATLYPTEYLEQLLRVAQHLREQRPGILGRRSVDPRFYIGSPPGTWPWSPGIEQVLREDADQVALPLLRRVALAEVMVPPEELAAVLLRDGSGYGLLRPEQLLSLAGELDANAEGFRRSLRRAGVLVDAYERIRSGYSGDWNVQFSALRLRYAAASAAGSLLPVAAEDPELAEKLLAWFDEHRRQLRLGFPRHALRDYGRDHRLFVSGRLPDLGGPRDYVVAMVRADMLHTLAAIAVYRHRHGCVPETLDELATEGLLVLPPRDPVSGLPYEYRHAPDEVELEWPLDADCSSGGRYWVGVRAVALDLPEPRP